MAPTTNFYRESGNDIQLFIFVSAGQHVTARNPGGFCQPTLGFMRYAPFASWRNTRVENQCVAQAHGLPDRVLGQSLAGKSEPIFVFNALMLEAVKQLA